MSRRVHLDRWHQRTAQQDQGKLTPTSQQFSPPTRSAFQLPEHCLGGWLLLRIPRGGEPVLGAKTGALARPCVPFWRQIAHRHDKPAPPRDHDLALMKTPGNFYEITIILEHPFPEIDSVANLSRFPSRPSPKPQRAWTIFQNGTSTAHPPHRRPAIIPMSTSGPLQCTLIRSAWERMSWSCARHGILMEHQTNSTTAMRPHG